MSISATRGLATPFSTKPATKPSSSGNVADRTQYFASGTELFGGPLVTIPENVEQKLSDRLWARPDLRRVDHALPKLGIADADDFAEFFRRFRGPFHSDSVGHELLDVVEQDESILSNTE